MKNLLPVMVFPIVAQAQWVPASIATTQLLIVEGLINPKKSPVELSGDFLCHAEPVEASQPY